MKYKRLAFAYSDVVFGLARGNFKAVRRYLSMGAIAGSVLCTGVAFCVSSSQAAKVSDYKAAVHESFVEWVTALWPEAQKLGVSFEIYVSAFKGVSLDWTLPELVPPAIEGFETPPKEVTRKEKKKKRQPEFDVPSRYFPEKSIKWSVQIGRKKLKEWGPSLRAIERKYGVQKHIVLAVWGRETAFGRAKLRHYAVRALATLAFMGARAEFFRGELLGALKILEEKHIDRKGMRSSWAGAMGHTQFLPSDFQRYAIDYNGDKRRDIWSTIPDALASTAYYLKSEGWESGKTWGYEIRVPKGFNCAQEGPGSARPIKEWLKQGVKRSFRRKFPKERLDENAFLLMPAGVRGPAFLVLKNFYVIKTYNAADLYALYVGYLADRIGTDRRFEGKWGRVDSFSRDGVRKLQQGLADRDFEVGKIDGLIGSKTRVAIGKYQRSAGLPVTCYPTRAQLKRLSAQTN